LVLAWPAASAGSRRPVILPSPRVRAAALVLRLEVRLEMRLEVRLAPAPA